MSYTVRIATAADEAPLADLLRMMHRENGMSPLAEDLMMNALRRGLMRDQAIIGVIDEDNRLAASVGLFVGNWWYSYDKHLEDLWNFVHPDYRRKPMARPLIEFAKGCAQALEMPLLMGVLSDERTAAKVRLYERQLPRVGGLFLYRPVKESA